VDFARLAPITFHHINDTQHLHYSRPTITLEPAVPSDGRRSGTEPRVTAVSYSPPFQGPLPRDTTDEFYDALGHFAELVEVPAAVYAHRLGEGDAVVLIIADCCMDVPRSRTGTKMRSRPTVMR
jgi:gamma-butyrobetaine dioxygenase